jgi:hypothetical protein
MRLLLAVLLSVVLGLNGAGVVSSAAPPPAEPAAHADMGLDHDGCGDSCDCCGDEAPADLGCLAACAASPALSAQPAALITPAFVFERHARLRPTELRARAPAPPRRPPRFAS